MSDLSLIIALVGPLPPPAGGMANQTRQLAELLSGEGVTVRTIQTQPPYRPTWIGRIPVLRTLCRLLPYLLALWRGCRGAQVVHIMANSGWSWHLFAAPAVWIAKLRGVGVVLNYRGGEAEEFFAKSFRWVRPTLALVDEIIVPSDFLCEVFARRGLKCRVVPNIIDLERFTAPTSRIDAHQSLRLLVARNLEPLYDNETAIRAFKMVRHEVPTSTLTIAGTGPELERLTKIVAELGLTEGVKFVGQVENRNMPGLMQEADIMINPSLADNMPISVLEAFASGLPVVSSNVGGMPYLISNEQTGILVTPRNPIALSAAILRLHRDTVMRARIVSAASDTARNFSWAKVWPLLAAVYGGVAHFPASHASSIQGIKQRMEHEDNH